MTRLTIHQVIDKAEVWALFAPYHYLTSSLNKAAQCWVVAWDDDLVAFTSSITMPSGTLVNAYREHRTVVLPDYQGLGIGAILGDWLGQLHFDRGQRFYSRTTHPRLARYRRASPLWVETKKSGKQRRSTWAQGPRWVPDSTRLAYSFEYRPSVVQYADMAPTSTKTKKAAPLPTKTIAKRVPAPPPPSTNGDGDDGEPMIRVAFSAEDLTKLVDHLSGWNDSIAYRLQMRLAKHQERWG